MFQTLDFLFYRFHKLFERFGYAHIAPQMSTMIISVLLSLNILALIFFIIAFQGIPILSVPLFIVLTIMLFSVPVWLYSRYLYQHNYDMVFIRFQGPKGEITKKGYLILLAYMFLSLAALFLAYYLCFSDALVEYD